MSDSKPRLDTPDAEMRYWRARSLAAERQLAEARERLLAFAAVLPVEYLPLLHGPLEKIHQHSPLSDPFAGWEETTSVQEAKVEDELRRVWARLGGGSDS